MKKNSHKIIFILGLLVFSYPLIGNRLSTTAYQSNIKEYNEVIRKTNKEDLEKEKEKVKKHNQELEEADLNYVDVFSDDPTLENKGSKSYYDALNLGEVIASIEIPKIGVNIPIYHGTSEKVLSKGAGHLENSALPSSELGTHSVVTAHRGLPSSKLFRDLNKVEIGDKFFIKVLDENIAYEIESIEVVLPSETNWLKSDDNLNKMTLLTCEPYMINTHRMLVTGHQVPYVEEISETVKVEETNYTYYLFIGFIPLLFSILMLVVLRVIYKKRKRDEIL